MIKICVVCGNEFDSKHGKITCSDYCYNENRKRVVFKNDMIRRGELKHEQLNCAVCGKKFIKNHYQRVYCSKECRDKAKAEKIKQYGKEYYKKNRETIIENVKRNNKKKKQDDGS